MVNWSASSRVNRNVKYVDLAVGTSTLATVVEFPSSQIEVLPKLNGDSPVSLCVGSLIALLFVG